MLRRKFIRRFISVLSGIGGIFISKNGDAKNQELSNIIAPNNDDLLRFLNSEIKSINSKISSLRISTPLDIGVHGTTSSTTVTSLFQRAIDNLEDGGVLDLLGETFVIDKGAQHISYPNGDQPCLIIKNKINCKIINGTLIVNRHALGALELLNCNNCIIRIKIIGAGNFPPIDGTTGRAEKGISGKGYFESEIANAIPRNNSKDTSHCTGGGYNGKFPQWGGGTASTWGIWNGGYICNYGYGITINSCTSCIVENCEISKFNGSGIYVIESSDILLRNNIIFDNYSAGIEIYSRLKSYNIRAIGNSLLNNGHPNASTHHTEIDPGYGIATNRGPKPASNILIDSNFCDKNKRKGIDSHSFHNIIVSNNFVSNSSIGIHLSGTSEAGGSLAETCIISANIVKNIIGPKNRAGIGINANTDNKQAIIKIFGNTIEEVSHNSNTGELGTGIAAGGGHAITISENTIANRRRKGCYGIALPSTSAFPYEYGIIQGNMISGLFLYGIFAGDITGPLAQKNNALIQNNQIVLSDPTWRSSQRSALNISRKFVDMINNAIILEENINYISGSGTNGTRVGTDILLLIKDDSPKFKIYGKSSDKKNNYIKSITSSSYGLTITLTDSSPSIFKIEGSIGSLGQSERISTAINPISTKISLDRRSAKIGFRKSATAPKFDFSSLLSAEDFIQISIFF